MEKSIIYLIIVLSITILLIAISIALYLLLPEKKLPETYDCYLFCIFWTPTTCSTKYSKNDECFQTIKKMGIEKYFTIHGLWPSTLEGIVPPACNEGLEDEKIIPNFDSDSQYNDKIGHYWPGLYSNNTYLWTNEYNKHGYCYMKRNYLNYIDDYKKYFDRTIEIFEGGYRDLMEDILPDMRGEYNVSKAKFRNMLQKSKFNISDHKTYCLICDQKKNLLSEIWFIYDLNFSRTSQKLHQEDCPDFFILNFTDETKKPIWEKYDYYAYAVQYSPNTCVWKGENCSNILKKKDYYKIGIHGLWPSYKSGIIPKECNIGKDIEINVDDNKEYFDNYILKHWYSLYNTDNSFLTHEYNTHGYCFNKRMGKDIYNYASYLNQTLKIYEKYNFSRTLDNIINELEYGENKISKSKIYEEIEKLYGQNTFKLRCYYYNNKYYLEEIHFKLDLNFELTNDANILDTCVDDSVWIIKLKRNN